MTAHDQHFDAEWWDNHYRDHGTGPVRPSPQLVAEIAGLSPGTALDAGCGNGADAIWLAEQGWTVTAVDISPTVVAQAQGLADQQTPEIAERVSCVVADLTAWDPPHQFDLVVSQYVHPGIDFGEFVSLLSAAVAPDGTLLVVGHDHADEHSAAHAPADASIGVSSVTDALGDGWEIEVAETRTRQASHDSDKPTMHDLVVKARRS